jgi:hypothetical protein
MPKKNSRVKRFLLDRKGELPNYYSQAGEILTLAYDYDEGVSVNKGYVEQIQIAIEQFNAFNLAKLVYRPRRETNLYADCPVDEKALRKEHLNQLIFSQDSEDTSEYTSVFPRILATASYISNINEYRKVLQEHFNKTLISFTTFAWITAKVEDPDFQDLAVGVLFHEIIHIFGIKDLIKFDIDHVNAILYPNVTTQRICEANETRDNLNCDILKWIKHSQGENYTSYFKFTPLSLFSLHQYSLKTIDPLFCLNKTRVSEILTEYRFPVAMQAAYFDLLERYRGYNHVLTYQDIAVLVQAIYLIAPDSLLGRKLDLPYYYLIKGMYRPADDGENLSRLISAFRVAENFSYPILAQPDICLSVYQNSLFEIDLIKKLKIVSCDSTPVNCFFEQAILFRGDLQLSNDCILTGYGQVVGNFTLPLILSNNLTELKRFIQFTVKEKNNPKNVILLGRPSVTHTLTKHSHIDVVALCHAVALPSQDELRCTSADFPEGLALVNCSVLGIDFANAYNLTVYFSNGAVNKTCKLQLFTANDSLVQDNLTAKSLVDAVFYAKYMHEDYVLEVNQAGYSLEMHPDILYRYVKQFNYLLTVPLLHGIVEGCTDELPLSPLLKLILKFVPRIILVAMSYLSSLQLPFLFFSSILESVMAKRLDASNAARLKYALNLLLFLLVAELEYGFSNLWLLADKPQFWPALTDRFNQLFVQMLWAPTMKATGYLLAVSAINCYYNEPLLTPKANQAANDEQCVPHSGLSLFFHSLKVAKDTVFSSKLKRIPSLFYKQFSQLPQQVVQAENEWIEASNLSQTKQVNIPIALGNAV